MNCQKCNGEMIGSDENYPTCEDCGFVQYDEYMLQLIAETKAEFERAQGEYFPDPAPSYGEYLAKPRKMR